MKILFFGDSITDMRRDREDAYPFCLGMGYVFLIANKLYKINPNYKIINRGCGGDKITDLINRLENDVIINKPDVLTILIGVNDVWHEITNNNGTPYQKWSNLFHEMLNRIQKELPKCKIFICEPFYLHGVATDYCYEQIKKVSKFAHKAKKIAKEHNVTFIPLQKRLEKLGDKVGNNNVLYDGIHPNVMGAELISTIWLGEFKKYEIK